MSNSDSEKERERLVQSYANLTEEQLQAAWDDLASLTPAAQAALQAEIERRGMGAVYDEEAQVRYGLEFSKFVTLRRYRDLQDALPAKGFLDSAGIDCFLDNANMVRLDWRISNALGGINLNVNSEQAEIATQLLEQDIPEKFLVEGIGEFHQPVCPKCNSLNITYEELNKPASWLTVILNVPIPIKRRRWACNSCRHIWQVPENVAGNSA